MTSRRKRARIVALMAGLVLVLVLAARIAGADGQCHSNHPSPQPSPTPKGLVQKAAWQWASFYANVQYTRGNVRYQVCHIWKIQ